MANDSGTTDGPRHIVGGRKPVRNAPDMAAVESLGWNPFGQALNKRLKGRVAQRTVRRHPDVAIPS